MAAATLDQKEKECGGGVTWLLLLAWAFKAYFSFLMFILGTIKNII